MAWFDEDQWRLLCALVPDRNELDDTYEQWHASACAAVEQIESRGHQVERVFVDVLALAEWCRERSLPMTGSSRAKYVSSPTTGLNRDKK